MLLVLSRLILALSLLAPAIVNRGLFFPFISGKAFFFRVAVELSAAFFIVHILASPNRKRILTSIIERLKQPIVIAVSIFALIFVITALTAQNPIQAFWSNFERGEGAFQLIHYYLFFILAVLLLDTRARFERILKLHLVISFFICLYAVGQYLGARFFTLPFLLATVERSSGTLGNPSYLAAYALLTLSFIAYFFIRTQSRMWKILLVLLGLFETIMLLNTGTRGVFIALILGLLIFLGLRAFSVQKKSVRIYLLASLILIVMLGGIFLATSNAAFWKKIPLTERFTNISSAVQELKPRLWTWQSALSGIIERPILGWGAENFGFAFDKYYNPNHFGIESFFDRTHNIFLEYLITGGFPLLIAFLSIFFFYYRLIRKLPKTALKDILMVIPIMYLVQGFFLFDVLAIYIALFLYLAFSLHIASPASEDALNSEGYEINGLSLTGGFAVLIGTMFLMYGTVVLPLEKNQTLAASFRQSSFQSAFTSYQNAVELSSPIGQEEAVSNAFKFSVSALESSLRNGTAVPTELVRAIVESNAVWFNDYRHTFVGVRDLYLIGGLYIRSGISFNQPDYLKRGKEIYQEALAYSPTRIEFLEVLMQVARAEADSETLTALLQRAKILRPDINWEKRLGIEN